MRTTLYWIEGSWRGRLGIAPRPRGGDWLEDEVRAWRTAGVGVVVSLLTPEEVRDLDLDREAESVAEAGMELVSFPVTDRGVPGSVRETATVVRKLESCLTEGKNVAIHCRAGVGRSALLAACTLAASGVNPEAALKRVEVARGCGVPDTSEQRAWVARFVREFAAA